uniref:Uncharacterized protein n=1 Tax=Arundo donax TaxID=35708 RepID=A0A0A9EQK9_ARUDO
MQSSQSIPSQEALFRLFFLISGPSGISGILFLSVIWSLSSILFLICFFLANFWGGQASSFLSTGCEWFAFAAGVAGDFLIASIRRFAASIRAILCFCNSIPAVNDGGGAS